MRIAVPALVALALAGCGGGERQDAGAPTGDFALEVTEASFPERQAVAAGATLRLEVANRGDRDVPDLAVTVETAPGVEGQGAAAFGQRSGDPALADSTRPVWLVDSEPARSAYANTWTIGRLPAGETRALEWRVTPIQAGRFTLAYRLAPALVGDAVATGEGASGEFTVTIDDEPVPARVNDDGEVVRGG